MRSTYLEGFYKIFLYFLSFFLLAFQWPMLGYNPQHTNFSNIKFPSVKFKKAWSFILSEHVWRYTKRRSVWSSSAIFARVEEKDLIFVGTYNNNLFCIDAEDGEEVWRFVSGGPVNSAPVFTYIRGRPVVVFISTDRVIYCLDAKTGRKLWNYQVYPWTFTVFEAITTSPIIINFADSPKVIIGVWYADRRPFRNVQKGEVLCLDVKTGKEIWRREISRSFLFTPAFSVVDSKPLVYIASYNGTLYCLSLKDGKLVWKYVASLPMSSTVFITELSGKKVVLVGTPFGLFYCLNAKSGEVVWKYKTGMNITVPGAIFKEKDRTLLFLPSYDRLVHCIDLDRRKVLWRFATGKYISSSPIVVWTGSKLSIVFTSLDNTLYMVEALSGRLLWKHNLGNRVWAYETRGETIWPSPIVGMMRDKPILIVPWYDGKIYTFIAEE